MVKTPKSLSAQLKKKKCKEGSHPVHTVICRSDKPPKKRSPWKKQEIEKLKVAIETIRPRVEDFKRALNNYIDVTEDKSLLKETTLKSFGEQLRIHTHGHIWSLTRIPEFISDAFTQMTDPVFVKAHPEPLKRYEYIIKKSTDFNIKNTVYKMKTVCLCVLEMTLHYYSRHNYHSKGKSIRG